MSFINPIKVPVKVYLSTDKDAPRLDRSANCVQTIFKACLVTGYGEKDGAGWSLPFEDTAKGIKVFRPEVSPETDFYLKMSNDTGREVTAQVYQNMTAVDNGDKRLECATPFKYGYGQMSGKWALIATARGIWFLFEQYYRYEDPNKAGGYFFCGDTAKNTLGNRAVLLKHTGGTWSDGAAYDVFNTSSEGSASHRLLDEKEQIYTPTMESFFDSKTLKTNTVLFAPIYALANKHYYPLIGIYTCPTGAIKNNFETYQDKMVFALSSYDRNYPLTNYYFDTEFWVY